VAILAMKVMQVWDMMFFKEFSQKQILTLSSTVALFFFFRPGSLKLVYTSSQQCLQGEIQTSKQYLYSSTSSMSCKFEQLFTMFQADAESVS
jgi:hypothetical protein